MLKPGNTAPLFTLPDADMAPVGLADFRGKHNVVLFFYSKDGTPSCILEATDFSDHEEAFQKHDCIALGISRDDCLKHAEFRDQHGISVPLLSDADGSVCRQYGVWQEKEANETEKAVGGPKRFGIVRSTFIINKRGTLLDALYGVNPKGHVADILRRLKELKL